jgi:hypothetical protein
MVSDTDPHVTAPAPPGVSSEELTRTERFARAREAVAAVRGQGRAANGQADAGNTLNLRHGLRSTQLLEQPEITAWHREQVDAITTDLGGDQELTALARASVREAARVAIAETRAVSTADPVDGNSLRLSHG